MKYQHREKRWFLWVFVEIPKYLAVAPPGMECRKYSPGLAKVAKTEWGDSAGLHSAIVSIDLGPGRESRAKSGESGLLLPVGGPIIVRNINYNACTISELRERLRMQFNLGLSQTRVSILSHFRLSNSCARRHAALIIAALLVASSFSDTGNCAASSQPVFQNLFHLVGIPGLRRDARVNLTGNSDGILFQSKKIEYEVPYAHIHQVLLLSADRRYEGRTYAAALATYGIGSLLILKKHHVDTVVLDYVNERGGKMGIVVQMETSQGEQLSSLLKSRGVSVVESEVLSQSSLKNETGNDMTKRSNP